MTRPDLRPRSAPEIVDAAVQLARRDYATLCAVAAPPFAAYGVVAGLFPAAGASRLLLWPLVSIAAAVASAVTVAAAAATFEGRRPSVAGAYRRLGERAWPALASGTYRNLLALVGLAILVVPSLYVTALYAVAPVVAMVEPRRGAAAVLRRTRELSRGARLRCFYAFALPWLFIYLAQYFAQYLYYWAAGVRAPAAGVVLSLALGVATAPLGAALQVVLYFDLRVRREAYDIEAMLAPAEAAA